MVVGARTEDVSQRMPGQTPDHPLMSHLHTAHLLLHTEGETSTHEGHPHVRYGVTHEGHPLVLDMGSPIHLIHLVAIFKT